MYLWLGAREEEDEVFGYFKVYDGDEVLIFINIYIMVDFFRIG